MANTDTDLVTSALAGSERAFEQLVQRYERLVFTMIFRILRDPSRTEELAQDTFVKAFLRLGTYKPERKFSSWLLAIAHNTAIDELRCGRVPTAPFEEAEWGQFRQDEGESPYRLAERKQVAAILDSAVRQLRPEYAEIITLRYQHDLTIEDIAEIVNVPVGTIKSSLHRAHKELATHLRARGWSGIG